MASSACSTRCAAAVANSARTATERVVRRSAATCASSATACTTIAVCRCCCASTAFARSSHASTRAASASCCAAAATARLPACACHTASRRRTAPASMRATTTVVVAGSAPRGCSGKRVGALASATITSSSAFASTTCPLPSRSGVAPPRTCRTAVPSLCLLHPPLSSSSPVPPAVPECWFPMSVVRHRVALGSIVPRTSNSWRGSEGRINGRGAEAGWEKTKSHSFCEVRRKK